MLQKCISFISLGFIPDYILNISLDITPVDVAAKAVYKLLTHPSKKNRIFHLYNHKTVSVGRFLKLFKRSNYNVEVLSKYHFKNKIISILKNDNTKSLLNNLIRDFDDKLYLDYTTDIKMNSHLVQALMKL